MRMTNLERADALSRYGLDIGGLPENSQRAAEIYSAIGGEFSDTDTGRASALADVLYTLMCDDPDVWAEGLAMAIGAARGRGLDPATGTEDDNTEDTESPFESDIYSALAEHGRIF